MDNFEKVEKLVAKANVSYEEAKKALDEANGDMLDAMIILEKQGKVNGPQQSIYTTNPSTATGYSDVPAAVEKSEKAESKGFFKTIGDGIKRAFNYTVDNRLRITRKGSLVMDIPLWLAIILMLCAWHLLLVVIVVSLFLDCRYSIQGKDDAKSVNDILNQASDLAGKAKESFTTQSAPAADTATQQAYQSPYRADEVNNAAAQQTATPAAQTVDSATQTVEPAAQADNTAAPQDFQNVDENK